MLCMQRSTITWLVLARELPPTIRVNGSERLSAALILDIDIGLIRGVAIDESHAGALRQAMLIALTQPAANLSPGPPTRVLCAIGLSPSVAPELTAAGLSNSTEVTEVEPDPEAEDIFDSLLGHLSGRTQPAQTPTPEDWQALLDQTLAFHQAEPWNRWSDDQQLLLTLDTDGGLREQYLALVMGQAGIQHGLALYAGHNLPADTRANEPEPGSIVLLLDRPQDLPVDITDKAQRYGWPTTESLSPAFMTFGPHGPEEISQADARVLTIALTAVLALDQRGLRPAEDGTLRGAVTLAGNDTVNYAVAHEPQPTELEHALRTHLSGHDLIAPGTAVTLGHLTWDAVAELRAAAHIHRPAPADAPDPKGPEVPLIVISPDPDQGPSLAATIAKLDPYGVSTVVSQDGQHSIVLIGANAAEVLMVMPTQHPALLAFQRRDRQTHGRHIVMVADVASATGDGAIYGLFECRQPVAPRPAKRSPSKKKRRH